MRGKQAKVRKIRVDSLYGSALVGKMINEIMQDGKKAIAETITYKSMECLKEDLKKDALEVVEKAVENIKPKIEVRPRRVGGVNYQVPVPVLERRQLSLALKWLVAGARSRRTKEPFFQTLADEIKDAYKGTGFAVKKKDDMHKMAEANKAFAHFQW